AGKPLAGVSVILYNVTTTLGTLASTDANGRYSAQKLMPGTYQVQALAPNFLPVLRQDVALRKGAHQIVNVTMNTLVEAIQWLPARKNSKQDDEDWKWTLRAAGNRPILRVVDGSPIVVANSNDPNDRTLKARVAFMASSEARPFGHSGEMTAFT